MKLNDKLPLHIRNRRPRIQKILAKAAGKKLPKPKPQPKPQPQVQPQPVITQEAFAALVETFFVEPAEADEAVATLAQAEDMQPEASTIAAEPESTPESPLTAPLFRLAEHRLRRRLQNPWTLSAIKYNRLSKRKSRGLRLG